MDDDPLLAALDSLGSRHVPIRLPGTGEQVLTGEERPDASP